jgi:hypothetical protein
LFLIDRRCEERSNLEVGQSKPRLYLGEKTDGNPNLKSFILLNVCCRGCFVSRNDDQRVNREKNKSEIESSKFEIPSYFYPNMLKLILRFLKLFFILFFGITIFWVILYRFVNPPVTLLMIERGFERKSDGKDWKIDKQWVNFDDMSDAMKRAAVAAEDQRFLDHFGFDFKAMERRWYIWRTSRFAGLFP